MLQVDLYFYCSLLVFINGFDGNRTQDEHNNHTEDSGLLKVLLPPFEKANNVKVDVISVGTGKALKLGENGDVDVVFVHARAAEVVCSGRLWSRST